MVAIKIKLKNSAKLLAAFRQAPRIMAKELQNTILKVGGFTVGEVKKHITTGTNMWKPPIRTGAMRRGISISQKMKLKVVISTSSITPYALYVHEGTRKMQARPFFDITAKRSKKDIERFFNKALDSAVKKIARKAL